MSIHSELYKSFLHITATTCQPVHQKPDRSKSKPHIETNCHKMAAEGFLWGDAANDPVVSLRYLLSGREPTTDSSARQRQPRKATEGLLL